MKITTLKENLLKALNTVERITGKNITLPILNNVLITSEGNFLKLSTTNLEIGINYWTLAKIEEKGTITVPARVFSNFVSLIPESKLSIETKDHTLYVSAEKYKSQIKGLDAKDFPIIPKIEPKVQIELNAKPFCSGISQVIDFSAIGFSRPELAGIYFLFTKDWVKIVATDSFRLAEKTLSFEKPQNIREPISFILPRDTAREIINIFAEEEGKIKISIAANQIMVESFFQETGTHKCSLVSRLIEGEYPNYQEVIPKNFKTQLTLPKNELLNQIKAISLFCGRGNEIKFKIDPSKKKIEIFSQDTDLGQARSTIVGEIKGEKIDSCFNYKFLLEGLEKIKENQVILGLNGDEGPGVIKSPNDETYLYIVMPIKES